MSARGLGQASVDPGPTFVASEVLYRSARSVVEAGTLDGAPVAAKRCADPGAARDLRRLQHEHRLLSGLDCERIVAARGFCERTGQLWLERLIGPDLHASQGPLTVAQFWPVALDACEALAALHERDIIHKDINPANLVWSGAGHVKLVDLNLAARCPRLRQGFAPPEELEGALAYLAPEQTGRMNRAVDHRADLYALGATFHFLLRGRPPFVERDPLKLLHCHIAAPAPDMPDLPSGLAALVRKLLAKDADERYQSAHGVRRDLELLRARGPDAGIELGRHDLSYRFTLPTKLHGRARESLALRRAFEEVQRGGGARLALVEGASGIGKTALVREVHRSMSGTGARYVYGKFDPYQRTTPYAALSDALGQLVRALQHEHGASLEQLRAEVSRRVGPEAGALSTVLPTLSPLLIASQPPARLAPLEAQSRTQALLLDALAVLATPSHPLVLFLDDLQWADTASLSLLETLASRARWLLCIGAYRADDVEREPALRSFLDRIAAQGALRLALGPLTPQDVQAYLAEALARPAVEVLDVARVLHQRTGGSPFFLGQTLIELYQNGHLSMQGGRWVWDAGQLRSLGVTDNVVDIVGRRLSRAPRALRRVLGHAAALGRRFSLTQLQRLLGTDAAQLDGVLADAARSGYVLPADHEWFLFSHDRVRRAAYEALPPEERRAAHHQIVEAWTDLGRGDDDLFELVGHVNQARADADPAFLRRAAALNSEAARRALASAAFEAAASFAEVAQALYAGPVPDVAARRRVRLIFADAQYSLGRYVEAQREYDCALDQELDPVQRAQIYRKKAVARTVEGRLEEALSYFGAIARELGFDFNTAPAPDEAEGMVEWARESLVEFGLAELDALPACEESRATALADACLHFGTIAFLHRPYSFKALSSYTVIHSFDWGVSASAPPVITAWASAAGAAGDHKLALAVAETGCRLAERYSTPSVQNRARTLYALFAAHYRHPLPEVLRELRARGEQSAAHGDIEYAGHAWVEHDYLLALSGGAAEEVTLRQRRTAEWAHSYGVVPAQRCTALLARFTEALEDAAVYDAWWEAWRARGEPSEPSHVEARELGLMCVAAVLYGDPARAREAARRYASRAIFLDGTLAAVLISFYAQLGWLTDDTVTPDELSAARLHAQTNPTICEPHARLQHLMAQTLRGESFEADPWDACLQLADQRHAALVGALTALYAARAAQRAGQRRLARSYAEEALGRLLAQGARGVVERRQVELAELGARASQGAAVAASQALSLPHGQAPSVDTKAALDLWSVVKASQAIASELHLTPLISKLLTVACELSGAQRALLLTPTDEEKGDGGLTIVAELQGGAQLTEREPLAGSARLPEELVLRAYQTGAPVIISDACRDSDWSEHPYFRQRGARSVLCMAVSKGEQLYGVLYLENALTAAAFTPAHLDVLRIVTSQAAAAVQNARFLEEEIERKRMQGELEAAARIQRALVPTSPRVRGCDVAVHMTPTEEVGGDYYDAVSVGDYDWFVVADVCGHGLPAGVIMVMCQAALHAVVRCAPDLSPREVLVRVNQVLKANLGRFEESKYIAACLFRRDARGCVTYAGLQEDVLIYRRASGSVEVQRAAGVWLGILDDISPMLVERELWLAPGDVLLLYTDGVTDARSLDDGRMLGGDALAALLGQLGREPVEAIRDGLLRALERYDLRDDATLFLLRERGEGAHGLGDAGA